MPLAVAVHAHPVAACTVTAVRVVGAGASGILTALLVAAVGAALPVAGAALLKALAAGGVGARDVTATVGRGVACGLRLATAGAIEALTPAAFSIKVARQVAAAALAIATRAVPGAAFGTGGTAVHPVVAQTAHATKTAALTAFRVGRT